MKKIFCLSLFCTAMLCGFTPKKSNCIAVCGDDKVLIINVDESSGEDVKIEWQWTMDDTKALLPAKYANKIRSTDDCKKVDGGKKILFSSSSGAAVLVDIATKKPIFWADVPNAHSIEMLPGDRVVVALSTADGGNAIELYNVSQPENVIFRDSLYSGHGVVWNSKLKRLYALGYDVLREYSLVDWKSNKPSLKLERSWNIPGTSGHDLTPINDNEMIVTVHENVWRFNIADQKFTDFEPLKNRENIKSVNFNSKTNSLIYTAAEISWWTHNIYLENPKKTITINDINLYKVRPF
ncbi:MAG: DUF6528 family protein [Rikenellaceae bacterium]